MVRLDHIQMDVFTDVPFGGSRLTVFPDGRGLATGLMQIIAREMGTSETAFIIPGDDRPRLRIFTPSAEIPHSGLSLVGATGALWELGGVPRDAQGEAHVTWSTEAGLFPVVVDESDGRPLFSLVLEPAEFIGQYYQRGKVARALGIDESEIAVTGLPCEIVSTGLPIHIVPVGSLEAVRSINLSRSAASLIMRDLGFGDLFVFTCEAEDADVHCRMFAQDFGIPEDAATGTACGSLVAYMVKHRLVPAGPRARIVCEQGLEMGRPSRLVAEADVSSGQARSIRVGGRCVKMGEGRLMFEADDVVG
ncbi:PhzF family phenazine biosynthesis protein [bacterium]|nr:PhzF family phenazine biosynthesis protein [bacterium]HPF33851.1 PhzF family phenazine biosynthesis protein [Candidatus Krumholzibacteria bacterium]HRX50439.1 PhzF family phenazine biosynthesis protein [Candidatus Krumholzibacteria bacterium]